MVRKEESKKEEERRRKTVMRRRRVTEVLSPLLSSFLLLPVVRLCRSEQTSSP